MRQFVICCMFYLNRYSYK